MKRFVNWRLPSWLPGPREGIRLFAFEVVAVAVIAIVGVLVSSMALLVF